MGALAMPTSVFAHHARSLNRVDGSVTSTATGAPVFLIEDHPPRTATINMVLTQCPDVMVTTINAAALLDNDATSTRHVAAVVIAMTFIADALGVARRVRAYAPMRVTPIVLIVPDGLLPSHMDEIAALGTADVLEVSVAHVMLPMKMAFLVRLYQSEQSRIAIETPQPNTFLSAVLETIEDGVVACDADGVLKLFNRATRRIHGLPERPVPPEQWPTYYGLYRPDRTTLLTKDEVPLYRALKGEYVRNVEIVIMPTQGTPRVLLASGGPLYDNEGRKIGAVVSMHDITALRSAEKLMREQARREEAEAAAGLVRKTEERLARLLEAAGEGIYGLNEQGICTFINRTGAQLLGYRPEELVGQSIHDVIHHHRLDGRVYPPEDCPIRHTVHGSEAVRVDHEVFWRKDGQPMPVSYSVSPLHVEGENAGAVVTFTDITDRKRAEDDLRRLAMELREADRRKTEFLAMLAHELRNPLAPLRNGLHIMRLAAADPPTLEKTRDMMERQLGHMVRLVDDLLDIARITRGKLDLQKQRVALHNVVKSAVETSAALIESAHHEFVLIMPDETLWLEVDPTRISQVLSNLLNNSAKYTPAGGRITLRVVRDASDAVISVEDNGVGIAPEALDAVFDMFTQVSRELERVHGGLGIGLTLVRRLVELHGGTVTATSDGLGCGSTFTVRLALA
ncbi:MAG TPA: PAS domain-containing sensor histidine kinase [Burkholderiaceae bacterium]|nr:PAS domain-containing sensor histidine kinase [Burkholderiaceae bacterium]